MKKRAKGVYLSDVLTRFGACKPAVAFARSRRGMPGGLRATYLAASGDWLDWVAARFSIEPAGTQADINAFYAAPYGSAEEAAAARRMYPYRTLLAALRKVTS